MKAATNDSHYDLNLKLMTLFESRFKKKFHSNIQVVKINGGAKFPDAVLKIEKLGKINVDFKRLVVSERDEARQKSTLNFYNIFSNIHHKLPVGTFMIDLTDEILFAPSETKRKFAESIVKYLENNLPADLTTSHKFPVIDKNIDRLIFKPFIFKPNATFFYVEYPFEHISFSKSLRKTLEKIILKYPDVKETMFVIHSNQMNYPQVIDEAINSNQELLKNFGPVFYFEEDDDEERLYKLKS